MTLLLHTFVTIFIISLNVQGYVYECLDKCQCDTDDEAIHCHNGQRNTLFLPSNRLRGFTVIGLTNNAIKRLPSESKIKEKFPELRAIDAEGNKDFDCDTLSEYETIKVYSDCEGGDSAIIIHGQRLPDIEEPTATCDFECQVKKHYRALHNYLIRIWQILKAKYEEMDKEKIVNDVKDFFLKLADRVNNNLNEIQLRMKNRDSTEHTPTRLVSATTTTRDSESEQ